MALKNSEEPCALEKLYLIHTVSVVSSQHCLVNRSSVSYNDYKQPCSLCQETTASLWRLKTLSVLFLDSTNTFSPSQLNHISAFYIWLWGSDSCCEMLPYILRIWSNMFNISSKSTSNLTLIRHSAIVSVYHYTDRKKKKTFLLAILVIMIKITFNN